MRWMRWNVVAWFALAPLAGPAAGADWPQWRGPNHDGTTKDQLATNWPSGGPKVLWKVPVGESLGTFVVKGDRAFLFTSRDEDEGLLALDAATGKELWFKPLAKTIFESRGGKGPRTTPAVDGDRVYVLGTYFHLACFDAKTGEIVWQHDLAKEHEAQNDTDGIVQWGNAASPLVEGNLVIVAGGGVNGQSFLAFDKATGKLAWKNGKEKITHASPAPATIHGVRQIIFFAQSGLVSVDVKSGMELWRYKFPFSVSTASTPIVGGKDGDVVYCSAGYGVGAGACRIVKLGDRLLAREIYRQRGDEHAFHWTTPVHRDGYLYGIWGFKQFSGGENAGQLKCMDIATGKFTWAQTGSGFGSGGGTVLAGDHLVVQADDGRIALVEADPQSYKLAAEARPLRGKAWTMAVVSNGKVFARTDKEGVCLDLGPATERAAAD